MEVLTEFWIRVHDSSLYLKVSSSFMEAVSQLRFLFTHHSMTLACIMLYKPRPQTSFLTSGHCHSIPAFLDWWTLRLIFLISPTKLIREQLSISFLIPLGLRASVSCSLFQLCIGINQTTRFSCNVEDKLFPMGSLLLAPEIPGSWTTDHLYLSMVCRQSFPLLIANSKELIVTCE